MFGGRVSHEQTLYWPDVGWAGSNGFGVVKLNMRGQDEGPVGVVVVQKDDGYIMDWCNIIFGVTESTWLA